jgi:hypothetical protein
MHTGISSFQVCVLDGCIFAAGGFASGSEISFVEKVDPLAWDSWTSVAPMQHARYGYAMAVLDGHIYVAGGKGTAQRSVERYDAATNSWSSVADMVQARSSFGLFVVNGRLTAVGGDSSTERYDAATNAWIVVFEVPRVAITRPTRYRCRNGLPRGSS